jgi:hypothetical protein
LQPEPKPCSKLQAAAGQPITLVDVLNPSIILMNSDPSIKLLLSRNTQIEQNAIHLQGVRLIEIPLGWRLALIRLASHLYKVRLPDEFEFCGLRINTSKTPSPVLADRTVIGRVKDATRLIQLTCAEYQSLWEMNGRTLHRWVTDRFSLALPPAIVTSLKNRRAA